MEIREVKNFSTGELVATQNVLNEVDYYTLLNCLKRHASGDFGDLCIEDKNSNNDAIENGGRIFSKYDLKEKSIYIITEWDRSYTTILFPEEY